MMKSKKYEIRDKRYDRKFSFAKSRGDILLTVLVFAAITLMVTIALVRWGSIMLAEIRNVKSNEQAFQIAEAGIDYYRWHLAQYPTDYKDGTTNTGPYVHQFFDKNGNILGSYSLTITPPPVGSTIVKILSMGTASLTPITVRKVQATMAIPSLAKFAVVANDNMRFGEGTEVFGPVQSNGGIRFDGLAHNLISSALQHYSDTDSDDCTPNGDAFGVHTCESSALYPNGDPAWSSNSTVPNRADVFMSSRQFPVPAIDFNGLTFGLAQLQTLARNGGIEWTQSKDSHNKPAKGYHIVLRTDGKYDIYTVITTQTASNNCSTNSGSSGQWDTWSIASQTLIGTYPIPGNDIIFLDDDVWVDGQINTSRVTIVAGIVGATNSASYVNITVNTNLRYTNYDGRDVIGLISQGDINVGLFSDPSFEVDAALVAENGRVGRYFYDSSCGSSFGRSALTLNGMIATNTRYGFAWTQPPINPTNDPIDCGGSIGRIASGYCTRNLNYDGNLLYGPPPSFPQATTQYQVISWKEVQ